MKIVTICSAVVLTMTAFAGHAADKQAVVKAPVLMTDSQMGEVVGGTVGPGFGICTAVGKAQAPGAIKNWTLDPMSTHQVGKINGQGYQPGFGLQTAGKAISDCGYQG